MKTDSSRQILRKLINGGAIPPFVYAYPIRSSYRSLKSKWTIESIWREDEAYSYSNDLNIYIHVPFCRYKCGFCNLYTVISEDQTLYDAYTEALCKQLEASRPIIEKRNLRTIYIGGGTPSLLSPHHFDILFGKIDKIYPNWRGVVEEVCIEASPDSVVDSESPNLIAHLISLGLTRANLGIQSLKRHELKEAGRPRANEEVVRRAIDIIRKHKLSNLSTDLIMGFAGQTDESWAESVQELALLRPETISTYFLTIRPDAWFSKTGRYFYQRDPSLYKRYDLARKVIKGAGYVQESNVRYKLLGSGGYRQKVRQFRGVPVLGIGSGARTYTNTVDYIIGGSHQPNLKQISDYIKTAHDPDRLVQEGFEYSDEERIRKRLVLDLFDLDLRELEPYNIHEYSWIYKDLLDICVKENLVLKVGLTRYQLTPKGYKYRDIISWMFFSEVVRQRDREFYLQLHQVNTRARATIGDPAVVKVA